jgi:diacylglycerol kinase
MKRFIKSFGFALAGIQVAFKSEQSLRIHILATVIAIAMGIYLKLSMTAWGFVILAIGFVLMAELFNTGIERLGDGASNGEQKLVIKKAKDVSAGAVLVSALTALVIGLLYLIIPFGQKLAELAQTR